MTPERASVTARRAAAGRRSTLRAALAIDVMAAAPLVSATSLGRALGMEVKNAALLLERFRAAGIAIEMTHRRRRRLFGLADLAPLRHGVAPPRRPEPGRARGQPPILPIAEEIAEPPPLPALTPLERREVDYSGLEAAMALADEAVRSVRRTLAQLRGGRSGCQGEAGQRHSGPRAGALRMLGSRRLHRGRRRMGTWPLRSQHSEEAIVRSGWPIGILCQSR